MKHKAILKSATAIAALKEYKYPTIPDWKDLVWEDPVEPKEMEPIAVVSHDLLRESIRVGHHRLTMMEVLAQEHVNEHLGILQPGLPNKASDPVTTTEEKKTDDLYDCPRKCGARLEWKDLQTHIQAGCDVKANSATEKDFFVLGPGDGANTQYGSFRNPHNFSIKISIEKA